MTTKTKPKTKEVKEEPIAFGGVATADPGPIGIGSGPSPAPAEPPKEEKKEEPKTVTIDDKDFYQHIKKTAVKAYAEINEHIRSLEECSIWDLNKKDIFAEIQAQADMGRSTASISGVIVPLGGTKIVLRTEAAYTECQMRLSELQFSCNVRSSPQMGLFIAISW